MGVGVWASLALSGCLERDVYTDDPRGLRTAAVSRLGTQQLASGVDILFVVDDSISMTDKQEVLKSSLNQAEAYAFRCIAEDETVTAPVDGVCPEGSTQSSLLWSFGNRAVVATSLEAGGLGCEDGGRGAHPLPAPSVEESIQGGGELGAHVAMVGESGCGYEAPLEAMYRFLVDPEPPLRVIARDDGTEMQTVAEGIDEELLAERAAFLHPYSQVVVIILTDEDDCSVADTGDAWKIGANEVARGSSVCEASPDSPCCRSCDTVETSPPPGCSPLEEDPVCAEMPTWASLDDPLNLRCWDQKRRFGKDWLFPLHRYTGALTSPTIVSRSGDTVPNPLFEHGRTPDMASVMLLAGVPWQTITTEESRIDSNVMEFMTPAELAASDVWSGLLGDPNAGIPPGDPHLLASVDPRAGLPGPGEDWDPYHGHEVDYPLKDDLQYSCIFALPEPRHCGFDEHCECAGEPTLKTPLCLQEDATYGPEQRFAKAYPPTRLLSFIQSLGEGGYLGSICPRQLDERTQPGFGYSDALRMLHRQAFGSVWDLSCFHGGLPLRADGAPNCKLLELHYEVVECDTLGRLPVNGAYTEAMLADSPPAEHGTVCEIPPMPGDPGNPASPAHACLHEMHPEVSEAGYCYIDPDRGIGNPELVAACNEGHKQRVRLIPQNLPLPGTFTQLMCDYGDK